MDLALYARVLWRFRLIVLVGIVLALTLAFVSVARLRLDGGLHVAYKGEQWGATSTIFVTQRGYPLGRAVFDEFAKVPGQSTVIPKLSDPSRFGPTALIYARIAMSDDVRRLMREMGAPEGRVAAQTQTAEVNSAVLLPTVNISAVAASADDATTLARTAVRALIEYNRAEQARNRIPPEKRIQLKVINLAQGAALVRGRPFTRAAAVFLAVMMLVVGLIFVLENARPRIRAVPTMPLRHASDGPEAVSSRR